MTVDDAIDLGRQAIMLTLLVGTPVMLVAALVGLLISLLQAVTQVQDQTISFVPKIVVMFLTILYLLPWFLSQFMDYTTELYRGIPGNL